jgi:hypothetical protein
MRKDTSFASCTVFLFTADMIRSRAGFEPPGEVQSLTTCMTSVPSMGGVEWSEPLLHSTPYQLEWSGVEWGLTPWTPWSGSKKGYPNSVSFGGI